MAMMDASAKAAAAAQEEEEEEEEQQKEKGDSGVVSYTIDELGSVLQSIYHSPLRSCRFGRSQL